MKKTSLWNRLLSIFLCLCMGIGMLPLGYLSAAPAHAASNVDGGLEGQEADVFTALGFDTSVLPEGYDAETVDNPYGRKKLTGNQVFEMLISNAGGVNPAGKNDNSLGISQVVGSSVGGADVPLTMFSTAAGDFDGDGLPGEAVYIGFETVNDSSSPDLNMTVYNGKKNTFSRLKSLGNVIRPAAMRHLDSYYFDYNMQNLLQVTAGDYDGDGFDEIAVYVAESGHARVEIHKWMRDDYSTAEDWHDLSKWSVVWSYALSNATSTSKIPNMVSLLSTDINRDGIDDLGISSGVFYINPNYDYGGEEIYTSAKSKAVILWGDRTRMLRDSYQINLMEETLDAQARVSLNAGDINNDGYDELIVTGQPIADLERNTTRTIIVYTYDGVGSLTALYNGSHKPVDGKYEYDEENQSYKWISNNGFDKYYSSLPNMRTNAAVVKLNGYDYSYLYLDSCMYEFVEGAMSLKISLDDSSYDGQNTLGTTWMREYEYVEYGAAAADINGNDYQQLYTSYYTPTSQTYIYINPYEGERKVGHSHYGGYGALEGNGNGGLSAACYSTSNEVPTSDTNPDTSNVCCFGATVVDVDVDTTIIEYTGFHYLEYSDPKLLAVIAAAPYFEDVDVICDYDYAWQNTTSWATTSGSGHSDLVSVDLEAGAFYASEKVAAAFMTSLETSVNFTLEWEKETSKTTEYTLTFETSQDEDSVAFYSIPTDNYVYMVHTPDGNGGYNPPKEQTVSRTFQPVYQVLNLDYYENIRLKHTNDLPEIRGKVLTSTPGDPASYPSSSSGYDVIAQWNSDAAGVSFGNGAITQEITITEEESESYNMGCALDFQIGFGGHAEDLFGLTAFEAQGGIQFSLNPGGGWTDLTLTGTTISGTVTNMPLEFQDYGYYYNWKLFSYAYEFNGDRIPVVSYIVNDVAQPPLLPGDFQQDVERTTSDKNVLTWSYDGDYSKFIIYKYFDFPVGGGLQEIAQFQAGEAPFVLKYDEDNKPYKEFYFEDTNLAPYSEYQYAIQVERLSEIPPLSAPSGLITARTKAAVGNPVSTIVESDRENNGDLLVYPDRNGYLTAEVTGPNAERDYDYYSTIQYQWQKKVDGAWVDQTNETGKTLAFTSSGMDIVGQYRCRLNVLTKSNNTAITAYSAPVEVRHAFRSSVISEVYVRETKGGTEFYVQVGNAHTDSGAIPSGSVDFTLRHVQSGEIFYHGGTLDSTGTYQYVKPGAYPAGTYEVEVRYGSSSIFKACYGEAVFLCQVEKGYSIDAPDYVTYGEGAQITFNEISTINGFAVKTPVYVSNFGTETGTPTEVIIDNISLQMPGWHSAPYINPGEPVVQYREYAVQTDIEGIDPGTYYDAIFYSPISGIYQGKTYDTGSMCLRVTGPEVLDQTHVKGNPTNKSYYMPENTPVGSYTVCMQTTDGAVYKKSIDVVARSIVLQLPTLVKKQDPNVEMGNITYGELNVVSGSWAGCDSDGNGNVTGWIATKSVVPSYINTAGTSYYQSAKLATCGYYRIGAQDTLDNYLVTYRAGAMSVIGGNKPVTFGVRPFEGKDVGTLYMVSPDYAYTREEKGLTLNQAVGSRVIFTAAPDEGYQIYDWYVNGVAQGITDVRFAYEMQNQSTTVEVQYVFRPDTLVFGIAGATEGGTLTCSDTSLTSGSIVIPNTYLTYTATAKEGYHFKEWRYTELGRGTAYYTEDDGKMSSSFELLMPTISCSLYAVFQRDGYTLTYTDKNGADGLTAWYWGNPSGDTTAALEKVTVKSGDPVPGGTQVVIQAKEGFSLDGEYNFVSIGDQGVADYNAGTYTLTVTGDTHVTGYTVQNYFDVTMAFDIQTTYVFCQGAQVTLNIDGTEYVYDCPQEAKTYSISEIPGGTPVSVSVQYPDYYEFDGWDVNGTVESSTAYTVRELGADTTFTLKLMEKPVYKVTLTDISGKGSYSVTIPEGAGREGNVVTCHENDPLTIQVTPETGYTVTYWNVKAPSTEESWETKASSLRYQFPTLQANYTFTPIFSTTTYHTVTWPTIRYYGVTLTPEKGCLATTASGSDFRFTLSGGTGAYSYVLANGLIFKDSATAEENYPHVYETKDGTRVYTIRNITGNQVISVSAEFVNNTLTAATDRPSAHLGQTIKVTTNYTGTKPTHYVIDDDSVINNGDGTFVINIDRNGATHSTYSYIIQSYYGSTLLAETEVNIPISCGYVSDISISCLDLTTDADGSYEITPADAYDYFGDPKLYRFEAWVYLSDINGYTTSPEVSWSVWGAQSRGTKVDADGTLTVSAKERGVDGQIKLVATYHYPDGSTDSRDKIIRLNSTAYVKTDVTDWRGGTVSEGGLFAAGETVTVTAAANEHYYINNWYINGVKVSGEISNVLTFTVEEWGRYEVEAEFDHIYVDADGDTYCDVCFEHERAVLVTAENYEQLELEESDIGSYAISTQGQMFWFSSQVNNGSTGITGILLADIDLENNPWTPIGTWNESIENGAREAFTGTFDGRGHVIKNLYSDIGDGREAGFFGRVQNATLKNFGVINATVSSTPVYGKSFRAGVIAGEIHNSTVENVFTAGTINVTTEHEQAGGIAGECADSTLIGCYTTFGCLTDGTAAQPESVTNCFYQAEEENPTSLGSFKTAEQFASGEVTWLLNGESGEGVWKQTLETDTVPGFTGGSVYRFSNCKGESGYTNDLDAAQYHNYDDEGFCTNVHPDGQVCGGYENAVLNDSNEYEISNPGQLYWFAQLIGGANRSTAAQNSDISIVLTEDVSLGDRPWYPIGTAQTPFTGSFDGAGYTVDLGAQTATAGYFGLFGNTAQASISNLTVTGSITVDATVDFVGGVVGNGYGGSITGCISYVDITLTENGTGSKKISGIVGGSYTGITISNCANYGDILTDGANECVAGITGYANEHITIYDCANYGDITANGVNYVAGILGYINNGAFKGLYNCLNVGTVTGDKEHCGDIIGWARDYAGNTIKNNYYTGIKDFGVDSQSGKTALATQVTAEQLASGEITWLLNGKTGEGVWKQTLPAATLPGFTGEAVHYFTDCTGTSGYANDVDAKWAHLWTEATCTQPKTCSVCGVTEGNALNHSYSTSVLTLAPTCGTQGVKTFTCDRCGDTHTEAVPATGNHVDENNNGSCDVCNYLMQPAIQRMASISLKGNIAINYYLLLSKEVLADETAYMQFTKANGEIIKIPVSQAVKRVRNGETYYTFSCSIDAKEMADTVLSRFFYDGGSTPERTYSVLTYAKNMLAKSDDEALKSLVTAMLHYGAAAQTYFSYNTSNLANADLPAVDYTGMTIEGFNPPNGNGTSLVKVYSATLLMESETTLRFYLKVDSSVESFAVTMDGKKLWPKYSGDLCYVDVKGIVAKDLDAYVTITISDGTESAKVTYNPMIYCASVVNNTSGAFSQEMKNLACALYGYSQAANAYLEGQINA